jgi:flavin-binding protein dodecin
MHLIFCTSNKTPTMAVIKVIEILANSTKSWEDAAQQAVSEAAKTIKNIKYNKNIRTNIYKHEQTQNKTNKNKVVLVVGHQHSETVIVDIFNKYIPELLKKYKVSFLDEIKKEILETSIIGNLTLSSKDYKDFNAKVCSRL